MKNLKKPKRHVSKLIIHSSATHEYRDIQPETIKKWHLERGFKDIGYHFIVTLDGNVHTGRPLEQEGAHTKGHNKDSVGICYVGGIDAGNVPVNTMNIMQLSSIMQAIYHLMKLFNLTEDDVYGHNDFAATDCPSFNVKEFIQQWKHMFILARL